MMAWTDMLRHWALRRSTELRVLLVIAAITLLIDGFLVERSLLHLMLSHPLLLLALSGALVLTEDPDPPGTPDER